MLLTLYMQVVFIFNFKQQCDTCVVNAEAVMQSWNPLKNCCISVSGPSRVTGVHEKPWIPSAAKRKWGRWSLRLQTNEVVSGISFMIEDLSPVSQPQNVTAACLLFLTLAPPSVGYNKRRPSSCRTLRLWFLMVIRRYNQWNKNALDASSPSNKCGSNASAHFETIKASAECV